MALLKIHVKSTKDSSFCLFPRIPKRVNPHSAYYLISPTQI